MEMEQVSENNIEYTFIFMNGGWWLKISTIEEAYEYAQQFIKDNK